MSRVTSVQLPLISYNPEGRYQPVRRIGNPSASTTSTQKKPSGPAAVFGGTGGGDKNRSGISSGSIIMLRDTAEEGAEGDYVELDKSLWPIGVDSQVLGEPETALAGPATVVSPQEVFEEAEMPAAFEYPFED